jgi:hypothetical protein
VSPNVEALAEILKAMLEGDSGNEVYLYLAQYLAGRGVLAVDSLTDEQAGELIEDVDWDSFYTGDGEAMIPAPGAAEAVRAALRRCATGETE